MVLRLLCTLRLVRNVIGAATYSPSPDWYSTTPRTITRAVQQPTRVEAAANNLQISAKNATSRMKPAQIVRSKSEIPNFPTIYRTEFGQNIEGAKQAASDDIRPGITAIGKSDSAAKTGAKGCETCSERSYQDGSDDPGVSFKSPTRIAPGNAAAAVSSHEQEHVGREQAKAQQENREIIAQSVQIYTAVCPECGKTYVSGGKTTTTSISSPEKVQAQEPAVGQNLDTYA